LGDGEKMLGVFGNAGRGAQVFFVTGVCRSSSQSVTGEMWGGGEWRHISKREERELNKSLWSRNTDRRPKALIFLNVFLYPG
jgi:hypothetical protein